MNDLNDFFKNTKQEYDEIQMPQNYEAMLNKLLEKNDHKRQKSHTYKANSLFVRTAVPIAASLLVFAAIINTSSSFAYAAYKIPVIGSIARFVTFREYNFENETSQGSVSIPKVDNISDTEIQDKINSIIESKISELEIEQENLDKEYKKAFLETGGKEEDYVKVETTIGSNLYFADENIISFEIYKYQTLAAAYDEAVYYTIDITTGKQLTLKDVLGVGYADTAKDSIIKQTDERMAENEDAVYFSDLIDDLKITEETSFYIDENKNIVIVLPKYSIAPGSMGSQEFIINPVRQ